MIGLRAGDKIRGYASVAGVIDFTMSGTVAGYVTPLADGQLTDSIGDLYTAPSIDIMKTMTLVNTSANPVTIHLFYLKSGGTARRLLAQDLVLGAKYSLHTDFEKITILDSAGAVVITSLGHNIASHSDTLATGPQLDELVGGGDTMLHTHLHTDIHRRGMIRLSAEYDTPLAVADQWYPVLGVFTDGANHGFSLTIDGQLTHTGNTAWILINGVADIEVDKACELTFGMFADGILIPGAETPHDFVANNKTDSIGITDINSIAKDLILQIYAKSSVVNTLLTTKNLRVSFWGEEAH